MSSKKMNMERLLQEVADYREFSGENQDMELSEEELDLVSAARSVPDYQDFLRQMEKRSKGDKDR